MKIKIPVTRHIAERLSESGIRHGKNVRLHRDSYNYFLPKIQMGYPHLSIEEQHALAVTCCMTHPDHKDKHRSYSWLSWVLLALAAFLALLLAAKASGQTGTSQIDVITFQNSSGVPIQSFAAPFKIKCSTNMTCTASGSILTISSSGGGAPVGYQTIQNAGIAIAQETVLNVLGALVCADNAGNVSSDCKLNTNAAVAHQFFTGIDASGNFLRAQPLYSDISGTPTLPATLANAAHKWFNSYDASTGLFTQTQPDYSDLTGTPALEYQTVQDEGGGLTQRATINFIGAGVTCADNAGSTRTDCTIPGGGGSTPTGTGFVHITSGSQDAAAKTVDVSSADITGVLAAADFPALTGDVTNSSGSLATTIASGAVARAKLAADALGWQFLGTATSTAATISVTLSTARKHIHARLVIGGYSGGGGAARAEFGNTSTVDTGSNYAFGGFNITSGTSTAPTVSGIGSGSTAQEGCPVSGSTTTAGREVLLDISNPGAVIKYGKISSIGVGASAAVTPNLAEIGCTWNNTTNGIGIIQFKACSATTGSCSTVNFTATTSLTVWGRDDN